MTIYVLFHNDQVIGAYTFREAAELEAQELAHDGDFDPDEYSIAETFLV